MAIEPHLVLPGMFGRSRAGVIAYPAEVSFNQRRARQKPKVTQCRRNECKSAKTKPNAPAMIYGHDVCTSFVVCIVIPSILVFP
jgi:hypothetical protein